MIKIKNVDFSYSDGIVALKNINIEIKEGESVLLLGPNGCGKSTLLKLINGLIFPQNGVYTFNNIDITEKYLDNDIKRKKFHKSIGFVFQNSDVQLFCSNVYDEIAFGVRQMGMDEGEVFKRVNDILNLLEIENLKDRPPYHLSGGEKRKVAIGAVLAMNPEVLVFDEPMNGLDARTKDFVKDLMNKLNQSGKTIICSTHDVEQIEGIFKRKIVFSEDKTILTD